MDQRTILTKTAKGLLETAGKTARLNRELKQVLSQVDGKATVADLQSRLNRLPEGKLLTALTKLVSEGFLREFITAPAGGPATELTQLPNGELADLDFTAATDGASRRPREHDEADDVARLIKENLQKNQGGDKGRAEAEAKRVQEEAVARARAEAAKREADQRTKAEQEARQRAEAEQRTKAEQEARQRAEAEQRAKAEQQARQRAEAEQRVKAELQARQRAEAEQRVRREQEARRQAEELARRKAEEDTRKRAESEAKRKAEELERMRVEAEERARREEAARKQAEEEARRKAQEVERVRAAAEADAKRKGEELERMRAEAEARAQREEAARKQAEEEARQNAQEVERIRIAAETEARRRSEEMERMRAEAEARARREETARKQAEEEARLNAQEVERIRVAAEAEAKRRSEELERMRADAEARAQREELARKEAQDEARRKAEELERLRAAAENDVKRKTEELERLRAAAETDVKRKTEELERLRAAAEAEAKRKAEELEQVRAKVEAEAQRKVQDLERMRAEAESRAQREAAERKQAELETRQKAEELERVRAKTSTELRPEQAVPAPRAGGNRKQGIRRLAQEAAQAAAQARFDREFAEERERSATRLRDGQEAQRRTEEERRKMDELASALEDAEKRGMEGTNGKTGKRKAYEPPGESQSPPGAAAPAASGNEQRPDTNSQGAAVSSQDSVDARGPVTLLNEEEIQALVADHGAEELVTTPPRSQPTAARSKTWSSGPVSTSGTPSVVPVSMSEQSASIRAPRTKDTGEAESVSVPRNSELLGDSDIPELTSIELSTRGFSLPSPSHAGLSESQEGRPSDSTVPGYTDLEQEKLRARERAEAAAAARRSERERELEAEQARLAANEPVQQQESATEAVAEPVPAVVVQPILPRRERRSRGWMYAVLLLVLIAGAVFGTTLYVRIDVPFYEHEASRYFGRPVHIAEASFALDPLPVIAFRDITIGAAGEFHVASAAVPVDADMLQTNDRFFKTIKLTGVTAQGDRLLDALFGSAAGGAGVGFQHIAASDVHIVTAAARLPAFTLSADMDRNRHVARLELHNEATSTFVSFVPAGEDRLTVEIQTAKLETPFGAGFSLRDFGMHGELSRSALKLTTFDARLFGGVVKGSALLDFKGPWTLSGKLEAKVIELSTAAPQIFTRGRVDGEATFSTSGARSQDLFAAPVVQGSFAATNGTLKLIDLNQSLQNPASVAGGTTEIDRASGELQIASNQLRLRSVLVTIGRVTGSGNFEVDMARGALSGRITAEVPAVDGARRAGFALGGTLDQPQLKRTN